MLITKKDEIMVNRLKSGHSYITHSYLMAGENAPECDKCNSELSIDHLFNCTDRSRREIRRKLQIVEWQDEIFDPSKINNIIQYIKEIGVYNVI